MAAHWKQAMRMQSGGVPRVAANGTCHAPPGSSGSNKSVDLALLASLSDRGGVPMVLSIRLGLFVGGVFGRVSPCVRCRRCWSCVMSARRLGQVGLLGLVEGSVFEHAVEDVATASGEADDGGVVAFPLGSFAPVVGVAFRVVERGDERGLP